MKDEVAAGIATAAGNALNFNDDGIQLCAIIVVVLGIVAVAAIWRVAEYHIKKNDVRGQIRVTIETGKVDIEKAKIRYQANSLLPPEEEE